MPLAQIPCCDVHYGRGSREIKIYRGPTYNQAGAGFFGDIFRKIVPLFTGKVLPCLGKHLAQTGTKVLEDIKGGTNIGAALKQGAKRTLERGKAAILRKLSGQGYKRPRKRAKLLWTTSLGNHALRTSLLQQPRC